jgi:IS66 Orf2 like protein.
MFFPEGRIRVFMYGQPVDGRKSFDGLYALTRTALQQDPVSGHLFCFINRRATLIRVLYWDRSGFCLWSKRLEQGRFLSGWDRVTTQEMDWTGLKLLLEGVEPKRFRKRFALAKTP